MPQTLKKQLEHQPKPFIKWAGGKTQLLPEILSRLPKSYNNYFEPFLGGGAVFFALNPKKAFLSDLSKDLITTYTVIKNDYEALANELSNYEYNEEFYYKLRAQDRDKENYEKLSNLKVAARFIYLNKTCFNGLYRVNSKGEFNVPFGKYKNPSLFKIENLKACSNALESTELNTASYLETLKQIKKDDLVYLDPPYSPLNKTSSFTSYTKDGFNNDKQKELRDFCIEVDKIGAKFILSNSYNTLILELYKDFKIETIKAKRAINSKANKRNSINEVIVRNY